MFHEFVIRKKFQSVGAAYVASFPNTNSTAGSNWLAQFLSATGLGSEMRLKSKLPPFSLICV